MIGVKDADQVDTKISVSDKTGVEEESKDIEIPLEKTKDLEGEFEVDFLFQRSTPSPKSYSCSLSAFLQPSKSV